MDFQAGGHCARFGVEMTRKQVGCNGERRAATLGRRLDIVDISFVLTSIPLPSNIDATTAYNPA